MEIFSDYNEKRLLELTSRGDERAYHVIFDRYQARIYSFAAFLTRSQFLAEEITQEVFMKIWQSRASLDRVENFAAYLKAISRNVAADHFNRLVAERRALDSLSAAPAPDETVEDDEYMRILEEAVEALPPQQKRVYLMHRRDGMKQEEIAAQLGISYHAVKEYMKKALASIRAYAADRADILIFMGAAIFFDN